MTRRQASPEAVAAAQASINKRNGVQAVQENKAGFPSVEEWIAKGGKVEVLPGPGDFFMDKSAVTYGS